MAGWLFLLAASVQLFLRAYTDDVEETHPPGHMQPLGSHRPMEGEIERIDYIPDPVTFYETYEEHSRPVILHQAIAKSWAVEMWTDDYLQEYFGETEVAVEMYKKENRNGPQDNLLLGEFIEDYNHTSMYVVNDLPEPMKEELFFPSCVACGGYLKNVHEIMMWFSSGGTRSVLHTDSSQNMHCLVSGEKRFIMIPPKYTKVIGPEWEGQGYYNLDVDEVNMTAYPNMVDVPWYKAVLNPGDCLYIPYHWIHHVASYNRNLGINLWWFPFTFNYTDCPTERRNLSSLVSLKGVKAMKHLDTVLLLHSAAMSGEVSLQSFKERFNEQFEEMNLPFHQDFLSEELLNQVFEIARPGCKGKIKLDELQYITHDRLEKIRNLLDAAEQDSIRKMVEKLEREGKQIPPELVGDDESDIDGVNVDDEDGKKSRFSYRPRQEATGHEEL